MQACAWRDSTAEIEALLNLAGQLDVGPDFSGGNENYCMTAEIVWIIVRLLISITWTRNESEL